MLFDANLIFSNSTSVATSTSTASSVIDLVNNRDLGNGAGVALPQIWVSTTGSLGVTAACASATLNIQFQGCTNSSATTGNWTTYAETGPMTTDSLGAQTRIALFDWPLKASGASMPRYVRLNYVIGLVGATVVSTGSLFAAVVMAGQANQGGEYPSGFSVL